MMQKKYQTFTEWFHEIENYGTRSERFFDELTNASPERIEEWMKTAWQLGSESKNTDSIKQKFDSESG
jgi:hypothetical protein